MHLKLRANLRLADESTRVGGLTFDLSKEWTPQIEHIAETLTKRPVKSERPKKWPPAMAAIARRPIGESSRASNPGLS
jgi:hypothetical protein